MRKGKKSQRDRNIQNKQKCKFCDRKFANKYSQLSHMRSVHFTLLRQQDKLTGDLHPLFQGLRTYECHRCKLSCCATNIKKHVRICKGEKRVVIQTINCELCTSRFSRKDSLQIHMRTRHSIHLSTEAMKNVPAEKSYKCTFCGKGFYRRREQIYHIRTRHFGLLRKQDRSTGDLHHLFRDVRTYEC